jgi:hypothetical protein
MTADKPIPRWQWAIGVVLIAAAVGFVAGDYSRFHLDFIPIDGSRIGPNLVASVVTWAVVLVVGVLVWPPTRRRIFHAVDRVVMTPIHAHFERVHSHNKWMAQLAATQHKAVTGLDPPDHPEHGKLT